MTTAHETALARDIAQIEALADLLDSRFRVPIIGYHIGLDGIIGLIPGIGDAASAGLGAYLIYKGYQLGVRKRTLLKMIGNAALDFLLGLIPILGDLLDFMNKSNAKNARLILEAYHHGKLRAPRG